jgi:hypothetical protein
VTRRTLVPWAVVGAVALAYALAVLAGGAPRFPSRSECVHPARADGNLEVVFGRFERAAEASELLEKVLAVGFKGSQVEPDGCGLLKVAVHGIPTLAVGEEVLAEARSVGLDPSLEQAE